jgi:RNA polymerase sigma-70 factor (ECF subfamily)
MGRGEAEARADAGAVYRELAPVVLGYLRAQGVPEPEDVLGEVFLHVARDLHRVRGDDLAVRKWVFTVARHRVIDDARRRARRPQIMGAPVPDSVDPAHGEPELDDPVLVAALERLTPDQREVVLLRFVADLPVWAVARITRRSVDAVKALQHRAMAQLAATVTREPQSAL